MGLRGCPTDATARVGLPEGGEELHPLGKHTSELNHGLALSFSLFIKQKLYY